MFSVFYRFLCTDFLSFKTNVCIVCIWASLPEIKRWNRMEWNGIVTYGIAIDLTNYGLSTKRKT